MFADVKKEISGPAFCHLLKISPKTSPLLDEEGSPSEGASRACAAMADSSAPTRVMMAVNESSLKGYLHPSISCRTAFDWTLSKLVRSNPGGFHFLFIHVQVPDEDGKYTRLPRCPCDLLAIMTRACYSAKSREMCVFSPPIHASALVPIKYVIWACLDVCCVELWILALPRARVATH